MASRCSASVEKGFTTDVSRKHRENSKYVLRNYSHLNNKSRSLIFRHSLTHFYPKKKTYSMFCFMILSFVFELTTEEFISLAQLSFISEDEVEGNEQHQNKFMLIPSIGFERNEIPGLYNVLVSGWYSEPLKSSGLAPLAEKGKRGFRHKLIKNSYHATLLLLGGIETYNRQQLKVRLAPFIVHGVANHPIELTLS